MIRVTRIQTFEFDPASEWYANDTPFKIIQKLEREQVEDEGDRYFTHRGRGATEITVEEITEERQEAA